MKLVLSCYSSWIIRSTSVRRNDSGNGFLTFPSIVLFWNHLGVFIISIRTGIPEIPNVFKLRLNEEQEHIVFNPKPP